MEHLVTTDTDVVCLHRFHPSLLPSPQGKWPLPDCSAGLYVDTETTGLGLTARIVEIALVPFSFQGDKIVAVHPAVAYLQDPGIPIPPDATKVSGITDEMVAGRQADWDRVVELLAAADLVVAHNASFDRPVVHRELRHRGKKPPEVLWGCSQTQVAWGDCLPAVPRVALAVLAAWCGFFFKAHRAQDDCQAALYLLHRTNTVGELFNNAQRPMFIVRALHSAFHTKDALKEREYRWDSDRKYWWKSFFDESEMEQERAWLTLSVYGGNFKGEVVRVPAVENFL